MGRASSDLERALDDFRAKVCERHCPTCSDNCCNGRVNPRLESLEGFKSLPVVRWFWQIPPEEGSYVVDRRTILGGSRFLAGPCPHFSGGRCDLFGRPSRPVECRLYPVSLQRPLWGLPFLFIIAAELSCPIFDDAENRADLSKLAGAYGIEVVFCAKRDRP
jgi:hypothetical protein